MKLFKQMMFICFIGCIYFVPAIVMYSVFHTTQLTFVWLFPMGIFAGAAAGIYLEDNFK